jgi:hypothetical protein
MLHSRLHTRHCSGASPQVRACARTRSRMSPCRPEARPLALLLMLASSAFGEDTSSPDPLLPPPAALPPSKRGLPKPVMRGPVPALVDTEAREDALSLPPPPKPWMRACSSSRERRLPSAWALQQGP